MKKPSTTKKRRNKVKNAALIKKYTPRVRQEYLDYDYLDQLSPEELAFLNKFTDEYLNASFKRDDTDIQSYEKYGKDCNDRNNARNRCLYGDLKNKANKFGSNQKLLDMHTTATNIDERIYRSTDPFQMENAYVNFMELKEIESYLQEYDQAMANFTDCE